jgi:hypothetical protein
VELPMGNKVCAVLRMEAVWDAYNSIQSVFF